MLSAFDGSGGSCLTSVGETLGTFETGQSEIKGKNGYRTGWLQRCFFFFFFFFQLLLPLTKNKAPGNFGVGIDSSTEPIETLQRLELIEFGT
jgi:hypothetical protein